MWLSLIDWNTEYYYVWTDATCEFKEWWICRSRGFIWHALKYCWADNGIRNPRCHPTSEGSRILQLKISATMSDVALKKFCWCYKKKNKALGGKFTTIITLEYECYMSAKYLEIAAVFLCTYLFVFFFLSPKIITLTISTVFFRSAFIQSQNKFGLIAAPVPASYSFSAQRLLGWERRNHLPPLPLHHISLVIAPQKSCPLKQR